MKLKYCIEYIVGFYRDPKALKYLEIAFLAHIAAIALTYIEVDYLKVYTEGNKLYYILGPQLFYIATTLLFTVAMLLPPLAKRAYEWSAERARRKGKHLTDMGLHYVILQFFTLISVIDAIHDFLALLSIFSINTSLLTTITSLLLRNPYLYTTMSIGFSATMLTLNYRKASRKL